MQPENMTVLLTGATGGIGQAVAHRLATLGADLHLTGRDDVALEALAQHLRPLCRTEQTIHPHVVDLMNADELTQFAQQLNALPHPVNVLINNAGVSRFAWLEDHSAAEIETMMQMNAVVPMQLCRALLPSLLRSPQARIVNVASTFGGLGFPGYSVYAASKHALRGFSESLARELADTSVSVGCFMPRATHTDINADAVVAMNRALKVNMDTPKSVAEQLVAFATSDATQRGVGFPEKWLIPLNALLPGLVSGSLKKQLATIKSFAKPSPVHPEPTVQHSAFGLK